MPFATAPPLMHRVRFECFADGKTEPVFDHISFDDPDAKEFWKLDKYGRHLHILRRMPLVWKTALQPRLSSERCFFSAAFLEGEASELPRDRIWDHGPD